MLLFRTSMLPRCFYYYYFIGANGGAFNQYKVKLLDAHLKQVMGVKIEHQSHSSVPKDFNYNILLICSGLTVANFIPYAAKFKSIVVNNPYILVVLTRQFKDLGGFFYFEKEPCM